MTESHLLRKIITLFDWISITHKFIKIRIYTNAVFSITIIIIFYFFKLLPYESIFLYLNYFVYIPILNSLVLLLDLLLKLSIMILVGNYCILITLNANNCNIVNPKCGLAFRKLIELSEQTLVLCQTTDSKRLMKIGLPAFCI